MKLSQAKISTTLLLLAVFTITFSKPIIPIMTSNPFSSINAARSFFVQNNDANLLLTKLETEDNFYVLTFEGQRVPARLPKSFVFIYGVDAENWKAFFQFTDNTRQEVAYLGTNGISTITPTLDPYDMCPLVAEIELELKVPGRIRLTVIGRDQESLNLTHTFPDFTASYPKLPVLGLYHAFNNSVLIEVLSPLGTVRLEQTVHIQTADISDRPSIQVKKNLYNDNKNHFFLILRNVYDEQGYLRWTRVGPPETDQREIFPLFGELLIGWRSKGDPNNVRVFTKLGETVQDYFVAGLAHHEMIEKTPGGNLLFGSKTDVMENAVREIDRVTGAEVNVWDMTDYVDRTRRWNPYLGNFPADRDDWFHLNSVRYVPADNTLVISSRHQDIVLKIGYDDGEIKWILGNHNDWKDEFKPYLLRPLNFNTTLHVDQDWTYLQHTAVPMPNGNVMIFDNGATRPGFTYDSTQDLKDALGLDWKPVYDQYEYKPPVGYARAVEYKIDEEAMTVEKVWEYSDFPTIPTSYIGGVYPIDDDLVLIGYGEHHTFSVFSKSAKETIFRAQDSGTFYRAYPWSFYPEEVEDKSGSLINSRNMLFVISFILSIFLI